mgnify:CR=1 FL=1
MQKLTTLFLPLVLSALLGASNVQAEEEDAPDYEQGSLLGDFDGQRTAAWRAGWAVDAALRLDLLRTRASPQTGSSSMTDFNFRVKADLEKIAGWQGAIAYLNVIDNRGRGVNARHVQGLMGESNIEVPVPTARIFHAWVQQSFFEDQLTLLAGLYPIDSEFFVMDSASTLISPPFGTPADLALTRGPSIFNNSAFGLRAKWLSPDRTVYAMGALLDGVPNDPDHPRRTAVKFRQSEGNFFIGELGWMPLEYGHTFEPSTPTEGLPTKSLLAHEKYGGVSKYAVGFWRYSKRVNDQLLTDAQGDPLLTRSQGAYALAERTLFSLGDSGRDFSVFGRYSRNDGDSEPIKSSWNAGIRIRGPLANRPDDTLALGVTRSALANKYRAAQSLLANETATNETLWEISWRAALTRYIAIQPVIQSIQHPAGSLEIPRVRTAGMRFEELF